MKKQIRLTFLILCSMLLLYSCGSDETVPPDVEVMPNYFPDAVGNRWGYQNSDGTQWTREIINEPNSQGEEYKVFVYRPPLSETEVGYLKPEQWRVTQNEVFFAVGEKLDRYIQNELPEIVKDEFVGLTLEIVIDPITPPDLVFLQEPLSSNRQWDALNVKRKGHIFLQNLGLLHIPFEVQISVKGAVVAEGPLETPAGNFDNTYQLEYQTEITHFVFEKTEITVQRQTVWFVPYVGIVKMEDELGVTTLIDYTVK